MNKRIKKLAEQAGFIDFIVFNRIESKEQVIEKFAQLIVAECAEIADTERPNSVGCGYITKTNGMRIKEHFGVEE